MALLSAENRLEMAGRALNAYKIRPITVAFIQHSENITFKVDASQGTYLLRLHVPATSAFGDYSSDILAINSEMLWLVELRKGRFPVPPPVKTRQGEYTAQVDGVNATLKNGWMGNC